MNIFTGESLSLLYSFIINVVVVTVQFLISFLFPVYCSYLSLWTLPFVPPIRGQGGEASHVLFTGSTKLENTTPKQWQHYTGKKYASVLNFRQYLEFDSKDSVTILYEPHTYLSPRSWLFWVSLKHFPLWNCCSASYIKNISLMFINSINGAHIPVDTMPSFIFTGLF